MDDAALAGVRATLDAAIDAHEAGDVTAAEAGYRAVVDHGYRVAEILPLLAGVLAQAGRAAEALAAWERLLAIVPDEPRALHEQALLLRGLGRRDAAIDSLARACALRPDDAVAANNHAVMLSDAGRKHAALAEFRRAATLQPGNVHIRHQIRRLGSELVPFWHIPMMNDVRRNDGFEAAIVAALAAKGEDAVVLDIGVGSGLMSLMAARAGARTIVGCEMEPVIAEMAGEIVARNGHADRIAILPCASTALEVGRDLPARADILVSEILSSDLLIENVLETFEDAHARLLKEDAIVIPRGASAMGCLVASETLTPYAFVGDVSGFDMGVFTGFASQRLPIHGTMTDWTRLSDDLELVHLDLTARAHAPGLRVLSVPVTADGTAIGIVQWMHVDLAEGVVFENHPDTYTDGGWLQVLHSFPAPAAVRAGETIDLAVGHDRSTLIVMPA